MPIAALDAIWHWMPVLDAKEDAEPLCREAVANWLSGLAHACFSYYNRILKSGEF